MRISPTSLPDVLLAEPRVFEDERGFFFESYSERTFARFGIETRFVQDNHSRSVQSVLRGIHYQLRQPQAKLVRVLHGEVFDVAVDLRRSSSSFGRWTGHVLSAANRRMLYIPEGFGHAFLVLSEIAEFAYKASDFYAPEHERTILWSDPDLAIDWPLHLLADSQPMVSARDATGVRLREAEVFEDPR